MTLLLRLFHNAFLIPKDGLHWYALSYDTGQDKLNAHDDRLDP